MTKKTKERTTRHQRRVLSIRTRRCTHSLDTIRWNLKSLSSLANLALGVLFSGSTGVGTTARPMHLRCSLMDPRAVIASSPY